MKKKLVFMLFIYCLGSIQIACPAVLNYYDNWYTSEGGNSTDGIVWGSYTLTTEAASLSSIIDMVCIDYDGNYQYAHCLFQTGKSQTICDKFTVQTDSYGYQYPSVISSGNCDLLGGNCDQPIGTQSSGDHWSLNVRALIADCDPIIPYTDQTLVKMYHVVSPKTYDCNPVGSTNYLFKGLANNWQTISSKNCVGDTKCDSDDSHVRHDDEDEYNPTDLLMQPCTLNDGDTHYYYCASDNDCYYDYCDGGGIRYDPICDSNEGTPDYRLYSYGYEDTCGGEGNQVSSPYSDYSCTDFLDSRYVCDDTLDRQNTNLWTVFCRKKIGTSCSQSSECWHDSLNVNCLNGYCSECGDGSCTAGETTVNCPADCVCVDTAGCDVCLSYINDNACDCNDECSSGYCVHEVCRSSATYCGDGFCDIGESCTADCGGGSGGSTDLQIVDVIPIQVVPGADMVKGKAGYIRVLVYNDGDIDATATVSVTFDGDPLPLALYDVDVKEIKKHTIEVFDFYCRFEDEGQNIPITANVETS
jgi:hypothetical protein